MRNRVENRKIINIVYITLIVLILFSNLFSAQLNIVFKSYPDISKTSNTRVHFVDVGQGDAIAISFSNGKTMLVDSGTIQYRNKLTRYLDKIVLNKTKVIDYLVLTHSDSDHLSNMEYIVDNYKINTFYRPPIYIEEENKIPYTNSIDYKSLINKLKSKDINVEFSVSGSEILDDNISIKWLYPDINDLYGYTNEAFNNLSSVILINDNGNKLLLTGDIDSTIETALINLYGDELLDIDVLKLAHHGSKNSTSELFLNTTTPNIAVACVGENTFGHPSNETIDRILAYDRLNNTDLFENFYTTKDKGNIVLTLNNEIKVNFIKNIDDYSFCPYFVYTLIAVVFLLYFMIIPYIKYWIEKRHRIKFNKNYIKHKQNKTKPIKSGF